MRGFGVMNGRRAPAIETRISRSCCQFRLGDVVDMSADPPEAIGIAHDHMRGHLGVFAFAPAWAPSSQSQVTSNTGPRFCSWMAFVHQFSEPA